MSGPTPFLVAVALGDGGEAVIPATDPGEVGRLLDRMAAACTRNGSPFPVVTISVAGGGHSAGEPDLHPPRDER